jgi:N-acetylmuramoyl-L-alanine amidase
MKKSKYLLKSICLFIVAAGMTIFYVPTAIAGAPLLKDMQNNGVEMVKKNNTVNLKTEEKINKESEKYMVCIDPGHPSEVSAADNIQNGTTEVSVNWTIANGLLSALSQKQGIKVILTRDNFKKMTTNRARAEVANDSGACISLRIHCDSGANNGITFYYPDRKGKTKNGDEGPSEEVIGSSKKAAEIINGAAGKILSPKLKINGIKGDSATLIGSKQGALTGSIYSKVPVVTVEMVYLNNKKDADFIKSDEGRDLMIKALSQGILDYIETISKK